MNGGMEMELGMGVGIRASDEWILLPLSPLLPRPFVVVVVASSVIGAWCLFPSFFACACIAPSPPPLLHSTSAPLPSSSSSRLVPANRLLLFFLFSGFVFGAPLLSLLQLLIFFFFCRCPWARRLWLEIQLQSSLPFYTLQCSVGYYGLVGILQPSRWNSKKYGKLTLTILLRMFKPNSYWTKAFVFRKI